MLPTCYPSSTCCRHRDPSCYRPLSSATSPLLADHCCFRPRLSSSGYARRPTQRDVCGHRLACRQCDNSAAYTRSRQSIHCATVLLQLLLRYCSACTFMRLLVYIILPISTRSWVIHADLRPHQCSLVLLFTQLPPADFDLCRFNHSLL